MKHRRKVNDTMQPRVAPQGLLTPKEAAEWLRISRTTLYTLPIRKIKIGRAARYELADLQAFVALNATRPMLPTRKAG